MVRSLSEQVQIFGLRSLIGLPRDLIDHTSYYFKNDKASFRIHNKRIYIKGDFNQAIFGFYQYCLSQKYGGLITMRLNSFVFISYEGKMTLTIDGKSARYKKIVDKFNSFNDDLILYR